MDQQVTETIITGMTKGEAAALVIGVICMFSAVILVLGYIIRLNLKPLASLPDDMLELKTKVKSGEELERMIKIRVQEHELTCPCRNKQKEKENE